MGQMIDQFDEDFQNTPTEDKLPDSKYNAYVKGYAFRETDDRLWFIITFHVIYNNKPFLQDRLYNLTPGKDSYQSNMLFLKKDLKMIGVTLKGSIKTMDTNEAIDNMVQVTLKTGTNGYQNLYINKLLSKKSVNASKQAENDPTSFDPKEFEKPIEITVTKISEEDDKYNI